MFANLFKRPQGLGMFGGQPETYESMGGYGPQASPAMGAGGQGGFQMHNPMLAMAGLGMLSGKNNRDAFGNAMQGAMVGAEYGERQDARRKKQAGEQALNTFISGQKLDPQTAAMLQANPELAQAYATTTLTPAKPTDDEREYERAKKDPAFAQYLIDQKRAGATNVNVGAEKGFDKTLGEGYGKVFLDGQAEARTAQSALGGLSVMERAMQDPNFYSGAGADTHLAIKRGLAAIGGDPSGPANMEVFRAQAQKAALDSMGGSLGTGFSNADRDFVLGQVPSLDNSPEGNRQLIDINKKVNQRKIDIAKEAREYAKRNGGRIDAGFDEHIAQWAEKNPLFPQATVGGTPDRAALEAEARRRGLIK